MSNNMRITTDHKWKDFVYGYELPEKIKKDFDYLDPEDLEYNRFMKYKGSYYDLHEFIRVENMENWNGVYNDSYFSGVLVELSGDLDQYRIGSYYC